MVEKSVKNYIEWCPQRAKRLDFGQRYDDIVYIVYIIHIVYIVYIVYIVRSVYIVYIVYIVPKSTYQQWWISGSTYNHQFS